MPFKEIYAVGFSNGNLHPHVNPNHWPDMRFSPDSTDFQTESFPDTDGLILGLTRPLVLAPGTTPRNAVYVAPPGGLPLASRILLRVQFDHPMAEHLTVAETWATALSVSPVAPLEIASSVSVTCQFNRSFNGVRANTPAALQNDQAALLESPLDYSRYQGSTYQPLPDDQAPPASNNSGGGPNAPSLFVFEHSFCGRNAGPDVKPGFGALTLYRKCAAPLRDHRLYTAQWPIPDAGIVALGVILASAKGLGRFSIRLRSFSVFINESL